MSLIQHYGFSRTFQRKKLTLGLALPFYNHNNQNIPLSHELELIQRAENIGFASLFIRDVPLIYKNVTYKSNGLDPFLYLTYISSQTKKIALGTGSIVTTLRHPIHTARAATTLDRLSNERLLLGVASGDRKFEFPAFKVKEEELSLNFQHSIETIRSLWKEELPFISNSLLELENSGLQTLPIHKNIPTFATGYSLQRLEYLKEHMDGLIFYPQPFQLQKETAKEWHENNEVFKPFMHPLLINLSKNPKEMGKPIKGGYRLGRYFLLDFLKACEDGNINHIILSFDTTERTLEDIFEEMGTFILPYFKPHK
ncbi:TIGR03571 family LLM class oxidoreductase [Niallia taxi]|nr:TIGR03571 family LLM class oxidoreductase [Niallia taxi]MDE5054425.1 TIGR03571 family LLM class oxidoreductase [Niallia taxi]